MVFYILSVNFPSMSYLGNLFKKRRNILVEALKGLKQEHLKVMLLVRRTRVGANTG